MGAFSKVRQIFRGRTAAEVHWAAIGRRCGKCKGPPVVEVLVFAPTHELVANAPQAAMRIAAQHEGNLPIVMLRGPGGEPRKFTPLMHEFACRHHAKELETLAARAPSSHFVDVKRGPGAERPQVSVA